MSHFKFYKVFIFISAFIIYSSVGLVFGAQMVSNQLIMKFGPDTRTDAYLEPYRGIILDSIPGQDVFLVYFSDEKSIEYFMNRRHDPDLQYVQPNYIWDLPENDQVDQTINPDESEPGYVQGESPPSYYDQPGSYDINIDSVLDYTTGLGVRVAVIDNGIKFDHPVFGGSFEDYGYDFIDNDDDASEGTGSALGHGTFVAGLIKLIAPDCTIMPLRAFNGNGVGNTFAVAQAVYYAIDNGADAINMSFSTYNNDSLISEAVDSAYNADLYMVAAVGNDSSNIVVYPAALEGVICVSAIDTTEQLAQFSNYGAHVDLCAPGVDVYSALAGEYEWGTWSGTSFAAPMVTAACALVSALTDTLTNPQMDAIITLSARDTLMHDTIPDGVYDTAYGHGCLDVYGAVSYYLNGGNKNRGGTKQLSGIAEVASLIDYIYRDRDRDGDQPKNMDIYDYDGNRIVNILDVTKLIQRSR